MTRIAAFVLLAHVAAMPYVYFGHRLAYDQQAAADSFEITRQFLDHRMRR